jgi:mono/diheme cytochrome c family protein
MGVRGRRPPARRERDRTEENDAGAKEPGDNAKGPSDKEQSDEEILLADLAAYQETEMTTPPISLTIMTLTVTVCSGRALAGSSLHQGSVYLRLAVKGPAVKNPAVKNRAVKNAVSGVVAAIWIAVTAWTVPQAAGPQSVTANASSVAGPYRQALDRYCVTCHNQRLKTAGLMLDTLDLAKISDSAETWEKVVRKLRTRAMPPQPSRRPDHATYERLIAWLEADLDRAAAARPNPGRPLLHRLNRAEYANAIRDLLALDVDGASLLPPDDSAYGFDNISDVLGVSPSLQERYLSAARTISALAVGDPDVAPGSETYVIRQDLSQDKHIEGLPLGTVGGILVRQTFPLDGEYIFQVKLYRTNLNIVRGLEYAHQVEFAVDGERIHLAAIGGKGDLATLFEKPTDTSDAVDARLRVRVPVKAGPHAVAVTFIQEPSVVDTVRLQPYLRSSVDNFDWSGRPHMQTLAITGPFGATGPGDTPSRRRIFTCSPSADRRRVAAETACAREILSTLARRAYRKPVTDADLRPVLGFYDAGRRQGSFERGIQMGLQRILASPQFMFRVERDPVNVAAGAVYRISDIELASRLSFFLWSSIPDDELLKVASQGKLKDPVVLERQVRRMLASDRARTLVGNFAGQWLHLRNVRSVLPNSDEFPDFDDNLRQGFQRETELLFESIMREDRNVLDLLRADYTFVNERLARHYGIPNVYGSYFRRVTITDEARRGLLGQGSILAVTSHAERTSPVLRGKWILDNIVGTPPAPPPPDVPVLKENEEGQKPRTMREQMAEHRANPVCASCHKVMDPIGFALENFDAVGAWRTREAGGAIDASGELADGTKVDGVVTLRETLLSRPDVFVGTMTEKLLTYGLGRGLDYHDMPVVRSIVRQAAASDYRFTALVLGIVNSVPFQMRKAKEITE